MGQNRRAGKPTILKTNRKYPTFQLYGEIKHNKVDSNTAFSICILEAFKWIRERMRDEDSIPEGLYLPDPENYSKFKKEMLRSMRLDYSSGVDIFYSQSNPRLWTMRVEEPDPGFNLGGDNERLPMPGRTFETNVSFLIEKESVYAGFKIICSQPADESEDCEVLRPGIVRSICDNPNLGLKQVVSLKGKPEKIKTDKDRKKLFNYLNDPQRQLPALLITRGDRFFEANESVLSFKDIDPVDKSNGEFNDYICETKPSGISEKEIEQMASNLIAVCNLYIIPENFFEKTDEFIRQVFIEKGDWVIAYPFNEPAEIITSYKVNNNTQRTIKRTEEKIKEYTKRKDIDFGPVKFYVDAILENDRTKENKLYSDRELVRAKDREIDSLKRKSRELEDFKHDYDGVYKDYLERGRKIKKLENELEEIKEKFIKLEKENIKLGEQKESINELKESYREMANNASKFPTRPEDIEKWVESELSDYIKLHPRAVKELEKCKWTCISTQDLCSGVYYLSGYAKLKRREISNKDLYDYYKINIPWEESHCGSTALKNNPSDYNIEVPKKKGGTKKVKLNLHLKQGIKNNDLIRIYFYWDKEKKVVVIGSWPEHLKT